MRLKPSALIVSILLVTSVLAFSFSVISAPAAAGQASDLFFSEYVEGSSYNKAIEIFNGTGAAVDLSDYQLEFWANGKTEPDGYPRVQVLSGTLADGDVWVGAHKKAIVGAHPKAVIPVGVADLIEDPTRAINFNGDDGTVLRKISTGLVVDAIGQYDVDPGKEWPGGGKDDTLVRNANVIQGDTDFYDAFTFATEWTKYPKNTVIYLGSHTWEPPAPYDVYLELNPDTLNLKSQGKWITAIIEVEGDYDAKDIVICSTTLVTPVTHMVSVPVTVTIRASEDSYVMEGQPDRNSGTYYRMYVGEEFSTEYLSERIFAKFDLSGIPSDAVISSADLRMNAKYSPSNGSYPYTPKTLSLDAKEVSDDSWKEAGSDNLTWNNQPAMGSILDTVVSQAAGWWTWDVTSYVVTEAAGDGTASIGVMSDLAESTPDDVSVWFYQGPNEDRPELVVSYSVLTEVIWTVDHESDPKYSFVSNPEYADVDEDGLDELIVKFDRQELTAALDGLEGTDVELTVTGEINGEDFEASDTIRVIRPGK